MSSDDFRTEFSQVLKEHRRLVERFATDQGPALYALARSIDECLQNHGKLLTFGNGGSAAQSQELAAELVNRYREDRPALAAMSLTADAPVLTSIGNDAAFGSVFSRQIEALGRPGDAALGISTSGRSANVVNGLRAARDRGLTTLGLLGGDGGEARELCDFPLVVPSSDTPRVQELHLIAIHVISGYLENRMSRTEPIAELEP